MWSAERFYGALCSSGGGSPALRFRKRVIRSQSKMPNTLPALTKPEMRDAVLSIRWEDISKLRVPRLIGWVYLQYNYRERCRRRGHHHRHCADGNVPDHWQDV